MLTAVSCDCTSHWLSCPCLQGLLTHQQTVHDQAMQALVQERNALKVSTDVVKQRLFVINHLQACTHYALAAICKKVAALCNLTHALCAGVDIVYVNGLL